MTATPLTRKRANHRALLLCAPSVLLAFLLATFAGPAVSAAQQDPRAGFKTQVFKTKHIDSRQLYSTLDLLRLEHRGQPELDTIIATGPPERLATFAEILSTLDQPPEATANLRITVAIVEASSEPLADSSSVKPAPFLSTAIQQLRELFGYEHFGVLDIAYLTASDRSKAAAEGGYKQNYDQVYGLSLRATVIDPPEGSDTHSIRLENLEFHSRRQDVAREARLLEVGINTNVEVLDGQIAVVGKASPANSNAAVILVLRVEIED